MKIAITGTTGLVGSALKTLLEQEGHEVWSISRRPPQGSHDIQWDPAAGTIEVAKLEGSNAVVHLAGENIAEGRWNEAKKNRIRESRIQGTRFIATTLASLPQPPEVLVSASAIGFYGECGQMAVDEQALPGDDFLAEVCLAWEAAATPAAEAGIRLVKLRIGVVLSSAGGALAKMLLPFKLGLGGKIGPGNQYMSWIALPDLVRAIEFCIVMKSLSGPVNAVAPEPVTNLEFTKSLGSVLRRPTLMPLPGFAARLVMGEMANALLLTTPRILPTRLVEAGFQFDSTEIDAGLRAVLKR